MRTGRRVNPNRPPSMSEIWNYVEIFLKDKIIKNQSVITFHIQNHTLWWCSANCAISEEVRNDKRVWPILNTITAFIHPNGSGKSMKHGIANCRNSLAAKLHICNPIYVQRQPDSEGHFIIKRHGHAQTQNSLTITSTKFSTLSDYLWLCGFNVKRDRHILRILRNYCVVLLWSLLRHRVHFAACSPSVPTTNSKTFPLRQVTHRTECLSRRDIPG